jgi:hypothetical protein
MGRFGFSLLATGLAFVWLGWYYHAEWAIVPGLVLLASLTVLAFFRLDATFGPFRSGADFDGTSTWQSLVFFAFYGFAGLGFLAALAHIGAGGDGYMTAITFVALGSVLAMYDFLPWDTARATTPRGNE